MYFVGWDLISTSEKTCSFAKTNTDYKKVKKLEDCRKAASTHVGVVAFYYVDTNVPGVWKKCCLFKTCTVKEMVMARNPGATYVLK